MTARQELDNLKFRLKAKTDGELAEILGTSKSSIDRWISRKEIPQKWKKIIELQFGDVSISSNTNSVIVNGSNNENIINSHQVSVSNELMEVIELFKEYGNAKILSKFKNELSKIKEISEKVKMSSVKVKKSVVVNKNSTKNIANKAQENSSYWTKNIGLSVFDNNNEIDWHETREIRFFRKDAKTNAGYDDPKIAAEEMMEFAEIDYYEILEAEFIQKYEFDPIWLRVKFLTSEVNIRKNANGKKIEKKLDDEEIFIEREL